MGLEENTLSIGDFTSIVTTQLDQYGSAVVSDLVRVKFANEWLNEGICPMVNCTGNVHQLEDEPGMACTECRLQFVSTTEGLHIYKRKDAK
jgi:hypothetical protein